jgi:hypothetical protein
MTRAHATDTQLKRHMALLGGCAARELPISCFVESLAATDTRAYSWRLQGPANTPY